MKVRTALGAMVLVASISAETCGALAAATQPGRSARATRILPSAARYDVKFRGYVRASGAFADVFDIEPGPDDALWFTEVSSNAIGRIDRAGNVKKYPVPNTYGTPIVITTGRDGNLWFTMGGGSRQAIGKMTTSGKVTLFPFGVPQGTELGITSGPDGNVWFTDFTNNMVGRVTPQGAISERPLPGLGVPNGITTGPDGNLWICEQGALQGSTNVPGRILRMTLEGAFTAFPLLPKDWTTVPLFITTGPDHNLWYTENDRTVVPFHVERITTAGVITEFSLPQGAEPTFKITVGADANLWVTEDLTYIDRVTTGGAITRYALPRPPGTTIPAQPRGIAPASWKYLYFTETSSGSIGVINPF